MPKTSNPELRRGALREYQEQLKIDKHDLDNVLIMQASLYHDVSLERAMAVSDRDLCKLELEELKAKLDRQIRREADEQKEKISENGITARMSGFASYRDKQRAYLDMKTRAEKWQVLEEAFSQRSYVLKDLVALFIAGYFTESSAGAASHRAKDSVSERNKQEAGKVRKRLREEE